MCTRLGKKHHQYVGTEGLQKLKKDRTHLNPKRRLIDTYRVRLLLEHTYLRDVFWNPQNDNLKGIGKTLSRRKMSHYIKLEKYFGRTGNGR